MVTWIIVGICVGGLLLVFISRKIEKANKLKKKEGVTSHPMIEQLEECIM